MISCVPCIKSKEVGTIITPFVDEEIETDSSNKTNGQLKTKKNNSNKKNNNKCTANKWRNSEVNLAVWPYICSSNHCAEQLLPIFLPFLSRLLHPDNSPPISLLQISKTSKIRNAFSYTVFSPGHHPCSLALPHIPKPSPHHQLVMPLTLGLVICAPQCRPAPIP